MKTLLKFNKIAYYITLVLFITVYLGLLAQILLGIIQLTSATFYTYKFCYKSKHIKNQLSIYWIITLIELSLLCLIFNSNIMSESFIISLLLYALFPMGIATYFLITITKITNEYENLKKPNLTL
jgi:hypothetical protein